MNRHNKSDVILNLTEFENLGEKLRLASGESLKRVYVQKNNYIAIVGYKVLKDFARFTSHEDLSNDIIDYAGKSRVYLTGLKRRGVYRRASEAILRQYNENYNCATPDHQCMNCYNCFTYGGVIARKDKTQAIKSKIKTTTSFSVQSDEEALIDEEEFHNIVHTDFRMEQAEKGKQKKPSLYNLLLVKPGTIFPFIDIIFNPTQFDVSMYLETIRRADVMGYGSRSSLLGTMQTRIVAMTDNLRLSHKELLSKIKVDETGNVDFVELKKEFVPEELVNEEQIKTIRTKLPELILKYQREIYGNTS